MALQAMPQQRAPTRPDEQPVNENSSARPQAMSLPLHTTPSSARGDCGGGVLREFYFDIGADGRAPSESANSPRPSTVGASSVTTAGRPSYDLLAASLNASVPEILARPTPLPALPSSLLCPISQQVMRDPVSTVDGLTYERECIVSWFQGGHRTSPVTEAELPSFELRPNTVLRAAIEEYMMLREYVQKNQREWGGYAALREFRVAQKLAQKKQQVRELKAALELSERKSVLLKSGNAMTSAASAVSVSSSTITPLSTNTPGSGAVSSSASPRAGTSLTALEQASACPEEGAQEAIGFKAGKAPRHPPMAAPQRHRRRRREACPVLLGS